MVTAHTPNNRILEARCDWLTATSRTGQGATVLQGRAKTWVERRHAEGYPVRPWRWQSYEGEIVDGISWGVRSTDLIVRLSGECAFRHSPTTFQWSTNVSRLDVQVTLQEPMLQRDWASIAMSMAGIDARVQSGMTETRIIHNTPRGATCYIGSGRGDRLMRVYDKSAESDDAYPPGCWRWEIEYKRNRAIRVAERLANQRWLPYGILECVRQAWNDYRVAIPCEGLPSDWKDSAPKIETTDERRLAWLRSSIRPMMTSLLEAYDQQTLLEAVGLDDYGSDLRVVERDIRVNQGDAGLAHSTEDWQYQRNVRGYPLTDQTVVDLNQTPTLGSV